MGLDMFGQLPYFKYWVYNIHVFYFKDWIDAGHFIGIFYFLHMAIYILASRAVVNNDDCVKFVSVESLCGGKIMMLCNKSLKNVTEKWQKKLSLNSSHFHIL